MVIIRTLPQTTAQKITRPLAHLVLNWWAVIVFATIATIVTAKPPYTAFGPPIRSDGLGYHAWTRAILDHKINFCRYQAMDNSQAISKPQPVTGMCINKYPPGLALLRLPVMAHFTAANHQQLRSPAEDTVNQILSILAGTVAVICMIVAACRLGVKRSIANSSVLAMTFGTGLFHYATYDSSFSHVYSAAIIGLLCVLAISYHRLATHAKKKHQTRRWLTILGITGCVGMLFLIRNPLLLVVGGLGACYYWRLRHLGLKTIISTHRTLLLSVGITLLLLVGLQLFYNHLLLGYLTFSSYPGEHLQVTQFKELWVLFSTEKGLFMWYPLMAVCLVCAAIWQRYMLLICVAVTLPLVLLYGSWWSPGLGAGFGHRGFVELAPIYGIAFAVSFSKIRQIHAKATVVFFSILTILFCIGSMRGFWIGNWATGKTSASDWFNYGLGNKNILVWVYSKLH